MVAKEPWGWPWVLGLALLAGLFLGLRTCSSSDSLAGAACRSWPYGLQELCCPVAATQSEVTLRGLIQGTLNLLLISRMDVRVYAQVFFC